MILKYSIIVPVFNRPQEIKELLESLEKQHHKEFEVIIVEDGSDIDAKDIVASFEDTLNIRYFFKPNSGAGQSRNYGMERATGNYFLILDSDVIVPEGYIAAIEKRLKTNFTDAFGGPDAAHPSFSLLQKAIDYSMTSMMTTGGIRGNKRAKNKFQPRSFNLGISKIAFEKTQGFSKMKIGEDIDLSFRLWELGFETQLIEEAYVFHKRRSTLKQFYQQTNNFGYARPFLNKKFPNTGKITYWFPTVFILLFLIALLGYAMGATFLISCFGVYFCILFIGCMFRYKDVIVATLCCITTLVQFTGYGLGFLKAQLGLSK
ncbi:MAG: glycosyl transferase family 2 [Flavobacteriaceae bacterium]|nr:MAG: glycosyl transferase family 2 [Flavobacteriaceae bacterium]